MNSMLRFYTLLEYVCYCTLLAAKGCPILVTFLRHGMPRAESKAGLKRIYIGYYDDRMSELINKRAATTFAILVVVVVFLTLPVPAQTNYFSDWPAGKSPAEVGKRVAEHFVASPHADPKHIVYQEVCTWYGGLTFAQLSGDKDLSAKLIQRFDPLMTPEGAHLIGQDRHVDFSVFGTVPLEIYLQTQTQAHGKDPKYLDLGRSFA